MNEKLIIDLTILGFFTIVCIASAIFRYEDRLQFLKDILLAFIIGCSCYLLLNNWFEDTRTRVGITGIVILCSKPLYDWANTFIKDWLIKLIMKRKRHHEQECCTIEENEDDN